jgi:hypothetical protein
MMMSGPCGHNLSWMAVLHLSGSPSFYSSRGARRGEGVESSKRPNLGLGLGPWAASTHVYTHETHVR